MSSASDYKDKVVVRQITEPTDKEIVWVRPAHTTMSKSIGVGTSPFSDTPYTAKTDMNGNTIWSNQIDTFTDDQIVGLVFDSNGYIYTASHEGYVRKIDLNGNEIWNIRESELHAIVIDDDDNVYIGAIDDNIQKIDPSGNKIWTFSGHTNNILDLYFKNNYIYSASKDRSVKKIDLNGNEIWSHTDSSVTEYFSIAVDGNGYVYVANSNWEVEKLSESGGSYGAYMLNDRVLAVGVDSNGFVYAGDDSGTLYKIDYSGSGSTVWTKSFSGEFIEVDQNDDIFIARGNIQKYDPSGNGVFIDVGVTYVSALDIFEPPVIPAEAFIYNHDTQQWESIGLLGDPA